MRGRRAADMAVTLAAAASGVVAAVAAGILKSPAYIPRLTQDVFTTGGFSSMTGALSNGGAFLWFGTGAILVFAALLLKALGQRHDARFLAIGGALTLYLWFDDFFMFHEALAKRWFGLDEDFVYASLALAGAAYLGACRLQIYRTAYAWLLLALACLGLSVASDVALQLVGLHPTGWWYVLEDGFKWCGIVLWARYHVGTAFGLLRDAVQVEAAHAGTSRPASQKAASASRQGGVRGFGASVSPLANRRSPCYWRRS